MQILEARFGKPTEEILHDLYIVQGKTLEEVGAELQITPGAVSRWLAWASIEARRPGPRPEAVA